MKKIVLYHFLKPGTGGVYSVVNNLVRFSGNGYIENHIIYTSTDNDTRQPLMEGAASTQFFRYSPKWNFYYTSRRLAKLITFTDAIIVAHDWLELGVVSALGLQHKVIQFIHGDYDYYYHLAKRHEKQVDLFIAVAKNIELQLKKCIPSRTTDIRYLRFPVPRVEQGKTDRDNNIIFTGRLEKEKGYDRLPEIAAALAAASVNLNWHIAGSASGKEMDIKWPKGIHIKFYGDINNDALLKLLPQMKYFILPSLAEGMPVSLIEAMKAAVIPITNDIDGGIKEMVINGQTGYRIMGNDPKFYVDIIKAMYHDVNLSNELSRNASELANQYFDPIENTRQIELVYEEVNKRPKKTKRAVKIYGSRMDNSWIPNWIVKNIRK